MKSVNISMPNSMRQYVASQVGDDTSYSTPSEYIRDLIRQDQRRRMFARVDALVLEGLEGGPGKVVDSNWKNEIMRQVRQRARDMAKTNGRAKTKAGR